MNMTTKTACVFGGTGFIGRQIVRELASAGWRVKVATRVPERAFDLKPCGNVGQVVAVACDYADPRSLAAAVKGCSAVINCIGILYEKGPRQTFENIHAVLPGNIAKACAAEGVQRFIHLSALGVDQSASKYAQSKMKGEHAARAAFPSVTFLRPSVVFGPGDSFFNMFARLSVLAPALPLIGGGHTKFQPVYVGDIADAVISCLQREDTAGNTYELGGPDVVTFRQIYERLFEATGRPRPLIRISWGLAKIQGTLMGMLPHPLLTADQVESLKTDNVVAKSAQNFTDLGIAPVAMDSILPTYLSRHRPGGRFGDKKRA